MKRLLSGVAILAALAVAAPVAAQRTGPGPGAETGTGPTGVSPGGPGPSSPLSKIPGHPHPPYPQAYRPSPAAAGPETPPSGPAAPEATSSMPPAQRSSRHAIHGKMASKRGTQLTGSAANELNREERARLQSGNYANPPAPPPSPAQMR
jgi:hypothetical protein